MYPYKPTRNRVHENIMIIIGDLTETFQRQIGHRHI